MNARPGTLPALLAGVIVIGVGAVYVSIIASQGPPAPGYCALCEPGVLLIAGIMFGGGALAVASTVAGGARGYLLAAASGMMAFVTAITLLSSLAPLAGVPMLLALGLVIRALLMAVRATGTSTAAAAGIALLTFVAGVGGEVATITLR